MFPYAGRTGTRKNLAALHRAGWGLMVSAKGVVRTEGFRYCLDNGAWWAYCNGQSFDEQAFLNAYVLAPGADFVVLPDIVAGGMRSFEFSMVWRQRLPAVCLQLLAVQDGMEPGEVAPLLGASMGVFIGGTTGWKERTMATWNGAARERGAYCHVGRVNTVRRIRLCAAAGADSFDGTSASRYAVTLPILDNARHQPDLFAPPHQ